MKRSLFFLYLKTIGFIFFTARSLYRVHLSRRHTNHTKKMSHNLATSRSLSSLQYHASSSSLKTTTKKTFSNTNNVIKRRSIVKTMIRSDLEPDNISVLVAGGSGVAMDVFRQLTAAGTWVTVLQRHDDNRKEVRRRQPHFWIGVEPPHFT